MLAETEPTGVAPAAGPLCPLDRLDCGKRHVIAGARIRLDDRYFLWEHQINAGAECCDAGIEMSRSKAMTRRLSLFAISMWCVLLWCLHANPSLSQQAAEAPQGVVWTAIIPDAFPRYIYTWHISPDGTYREDGRDAATGAAIQAALSGQWSVDGPRMILRQRDLPYVFDGVVLGGLYTGTLYLNGRFASQFCAAKGESAPQSCGKKPGVALLGEIASR